MLYAVMDIGSNAIRAVVYESNKIASKKIYSNKFKSDIYSLLKKDSLDIKHTSYLIIEYFVHIFQQIGVQQVKCVATAVLRGNSNASIFQEIVLRRYNINIEILSGEQESYLSTIGLMLGIQEVEGIIADLGGGSLELSLVQQQKITNCQSLLLGTKVLGSLEKTIETASIINQLQYFSHNKHHNLYLIGGAFRLITQSYMHFINYPISNLHDFRVPVSDILPYITQLININCEDNNYYISRFKININSVKVLQALISAFSIQNIIVSSYGLKEGVHVQHCLFPTCNLPTQIDSLNDAFSRFFDVIKTDQIIYDHCTRILTFRGNICNADKYVQMIQPLLVQPDDCSIQTIKMLLILICNNKLGIFFSVNAMIEYILQSDLPISYRHRLMLSLTLSKSFNYSLMIPYITKIAEQILSKKDFYNSIITGTIISIIHDIDGVFLQEPSFKFIIKGSFIELDTKIALPRTIWVKIISKLKKISALRKHISYINN